MAEVWKMNIEAPVFVKTNLKCFRAKVARAVDHTNDPLGSKGSHSLYWKSLHSHLIRPKQT